MDLIHFVTSKPGVKAKGAQFTSGTTVAVPSGAGLSDYVNLPVPGSGMERAMWFSERAPKVRTAPEGKISLCNPSGASSIGMHERMVLGVTRDDMLGAQVLRDNNWSNFDDPATAQSEDVARIWMAQTAATNGLWDHNGEVYVSQDASTIWS